MLDGGAQEMAACLLPYEDPAHVPDKASPQSSSLDPFGGLCDPEESALGLRYLADMGNYEEARSRRLKNGKGKGKRDEEEPGDSGEGKKDKK